MPQSGPQIEAKPNRQMILIYFSTEYVVVMKLNTSDNTWNIQTNLPSRPTSHCIRERETGYDANNSTDRDIGSYQTPINYSSRP